MKEIRLQGRGGQGVVKASQLVVEAAVAEGLYGQAIPFFGVERKGSPVFGYLRLSHEPIRRRMQVYEPDILIIFDDSLVSAPETFDGLKAGGMVILNTTKTREELPLPPQAGSVWLVDGTAISEDILGRNMPNTAMLGAFAKATGLVDKSTLLDKIEHAFGLKNREVAARAYDSAAEYK